MNFSTPRQTMYRIYCKNSPSNSKGAFMGSSSVESLESDSSSDDASSPFTSTSFRFWNKTIWRICSETEHKSSILNVTPSQYLCFVICYHNCPTQEKIKTHWFQSIHTGPYSWATGLNSQQRWTEEEARGFCPKCLFIMTHFTPNIIY